MTPPTTTTQQQQLCRRMAMMTSTRRGGRRTSAAATLPGAHGCWRARRDGSKGKTTGRNSSTLAFSQETDRLVAFHYDISLARSPVVGPVACPWRGVDHGSVKREGPVRVRCMAQLRRDAHVIVVPNASALPEARDRVLEFAENGRNRGRRARRRPLHRPLHRLNLPPSRPRPPRHERCLVLGPIRFSQPLEEQRVACSPCRRI
jgi:hypothetical protein